MPYPGRIDQSALGAQALHHLEANPDRSDWSLREVAAMVGVTPNALYRYVGDKEGLRVEMAAAAADELLVELTAVEEAGIERIVAIANAYVAFGVARPVAYQLFTDAKPDPGDPRVAAWMRLWSCVQEAVRAVVPDAADACGLALWSLVHGRLSLSRGATRAVSPDAGLSHAVSALVSGCRSAGKLPSPLPEWMRSTLPADRSIPS